MNTTQLTLEMIEGLPLRDVVFATLRRAILSGDFQPGERLMEIPLANQLGVSRTPVREAIRMLDQEGLVTMLPRRGAVVAEITRQDLEDVLEVRGALEELAVRCACRNMTAEDLAKLEEAAEEFIRCLERGDLHASAEADVAFHEVISNATGNRRLVQILHNLREQIYRYRLENLKDRSAYPALIEQHRAIVDALKARAVNEAVMAVHSHISGQRISIMENLHI